VWFSGRLDSRRDGCVVHCESGTKYENTVAACLHSTRTLTDNVIIFLYAQHCSFHGLQPVQAKRNWRMMQPVH
jgi:hypothetical protein